MRERRVRRPGRDLPIPPAPPPPVGLPPNIGYQRDAAQVEFYKAATRLCELASRWVEQKL